MRRWTLILMAVIAVVLTLLIVACAPVTPSPPEVIEEEVEVTVEVETPVEVEEVVESETPEAELEVITFVVWAEDDLGERARQEMVDYYQGIYPEVEINLIIMRDR